MSMIAWIGLHDRRQHLHHLTFVVYWCAEGHIPDAERSSTYYNDSEWAEPEHHKSSLNEPPMPTVAEEPMAEEAAVEATQPKESGEQQTQAHNTHAQGTLALPQDIQLHESEPETREAQSLQTQPHQTQAQQQHAREEPEAEASPSGVHDESGAQPQPERPHHSLAGEARTWSASCDTQWKDHV